MNYRVALNYLNSFINYERWVTVNPNRAFNLERMRLFSRRLGHPERKFPSVLVAGTKGKGSTVAILGSILGASGYRVGTYTSPHLVDLRERIQVDGRWISPSDFACGMTEIRRRLGRQKPTYFEVMTLLAFWQFARKQVDIAVVEVGMGGRLDATNVLEPLVAVITSVSYDHTRELGSTLREIAREKAGIIHPRSVVVTAPQEKEVMRVIRARAKRVGAPLVGIRGGQPRGLPLLGDFQIENAGVAVSAARILPKMGFDKINARSIQRGLQSVRWPGRFEIARRNPTVILDGAHNGESMEALARSTRKMFPAAKIFPVLGISQGKDLKRMADALSRVTDTLIVTEYQEVRAWDAQELTHSLDGKFQRIMIASPVNQAIKLARTLTDPGDVVLVTGSLFLVGEAKSLLSFPRKRESSVVGKDPGSPLSRG